MDKFDNYELCTYCGTFKHDNIVKEPYGIVKAFGERQEYVVIKDKEMFERVKDSFVDERYHYVEFIRFENNKFIKEVLYAETSEKSI